MSQEKKKNPTIDPLMFDDVCPLCGNKLPTEEEKIISKDYPDLTIYYRCKCGYKWSINEVIIPWLA